jgi:hypothetical protein
MGSRCSVVRPFYRRTYSGNYIHYVHGTSLWHANLTLSLFDNSFLVGISFQDTSGIQSSYSTLTLTWLGVRLLHLWFRYQSLIVLKFRTVRCLT